MTLPHGADHNAGILADQNSRTADSAGDDKLDDGSGGSRASRPGTLAYSAPALASPVMTTTSHRKGVLRSQPAKSA